MAQNLNLLAEKKVELEYALAAKENAIQQQQQQQNMMESQYSYFNNTTNKIDSSIRPSTDENNASDCVIEKVTQNDLGKSINQTPKLNETTNQQSQYQSGEEMDASLSTYKTPVLTPLTATRLNPFAKNNLSTKISSQTPSNDSPKSILNKIEEKVQQSGGSVAKEKDSWKPISTKKSNLKPSKF